MSRLNKDASGMTLANGNFVSMNEYMYMKYALDSFNAKPSLLRELQIAWEAGIPLIIKD